MSLAIQPIDFLHPENVCGRTLLSLVARGSAVIAELLRLSDHVPPIFDSAHKFAPLLIDCRFLKSPELYESAIDSSTELSELDEELRDTHSIIFARFYQLFESIFKYSADLLIFLEELHEGVFVQHTIESTLEDREGSQLMCEAFYQFGVMLLMMDKRIDGTIREKLIMTHLRLSGAGTLPNLDDVVRLCRSTGLIVNKHRPAAYPDDLFNRIKFPIEVILLCISRLRADDVYNNTSAFPSPHHRSLAYSQQANVIFVMLFYVPDVLHRREQIMREIIDKHFPDNYIALTYLGSVWDLSDAWQPYKAASLALKNTLNKANLEPEITKHAKAVTALNIELKSLLVEGALTAEFVLSHPRKLMELVRNCNNTLRFFLLHRETIIAPLRAFIEKAAPANDLLELLLNTAQFEFLFRRELKHLLDSKEATWKENQNEIHSRLTDLSAYFSGSAHLTRVAKNASLQEWFASLASEISALEYTNSILVGRKMSTLISALEEVQNFHQINESIQVKSFLHECRESLKKMVKIVNINAKLMGDLDIISDMAYAWELINGYTDLLHERIKQNPKNCLLMRSLFLKLSSLLNFPLNRITQCESPDDVSVADFYSSKLIAYVRSILEIVPITVFVLLDDIISLQVKEMRMLPSKMERKHMVEFAQLSQRFELARLTHEISVFTQGILQMKSTIMGILAMDPKLLLESGIRQELVKKNTFALHEILFFPRSGNLPDFEARLAELGDKLEGFKLSFEYIQDYIHLYGLKIWQEELSRIINYHVEMEANLFIKKKVLDHQSKYQSDEIPIPQLAVHRTQTPSLALYPEPVNFMGRLCRELLVLTSPQTTIYVDGAQGWQDCAQAAQERIGIKTFSLLHRGLGIHGLLGLDRLFSFMIVKHLHDFIKLSRKIISPNVDNYLLKFAHELHPLTQFPTQAAALYDNALAKMNKILPLFLQFILSIGQIQLIRKQIAHELNFTAKLESKILNDHVENFNHLLIEALQQHYSAPDTTPQFPGRDTHLLSEISSLIEACGIMNPMTKIYVTTKPIEHLPLIMFLFVLHHMQSLVYSKKRNTLINVAHASAPNPAAKSKAKSAVPAAAVFDGAPLIVGVVTVLQQFHSDHTHTFLSYIGQRIRGAVSDSGAQAPSVIKLLHFCEEFCRFSHTSRKAIEATVPQYVIDRFHAAE